MAVLGEIAGQVLDVFSGAIRQAGVITVILLVRASHCGGQGESRVSILDEREVD